MSVAESANRQGSFRFWLFLTPVFTALGPWLSLNPGQEGQVSGLRASLIFMLPLAFRALSSGKAPKSVKTLGVASLTLVGWAALSLLWTPDPEAGQRELIGMALLIASAWTVAVGIATVDGAIDAITRGFLVAVAIVGSVAAWEMTTGNHLLVLSQGWVFGDSPVATFNNPNNLAAFLVASIPVLMMRIVRPKGGVGKIPYLFALVANIYVISETGSRLGIIAALSIAIGFIACVAIRNPGRWVVPLLGLALLGVMALLASGERIIRVILLPFDVDSSALERSDELRTSLISRAWAELVDSSFMGVGAGGIEAVLLSADSSATNVHNSLVEGVSQFGVIGLLCFFVMIIRPAWATLTGAVANRATKVWVAFLATSIVVTSAMGSSMLAEPSWWLQIGILSGIAGSVQASVMERNVGQ